MSKDVATKINVETLKKNEAKWSKPLMDAGWNAFPSVFIEKQGALGLDAIDMNIILHLSNYWWTKENLPYPSVGTIAKAIGIKPRTVQKRVKALSELGLVTRHERRIPNQGSKTNLYSFEGLIKAALPHALEKLEQISEREKQNKERLSRKKPKLTIVASDKG